jgi:hypothetical protein
MCGKDYDNKRKIFKTHMCGGQPSLVPYLSFEEEKGGYFCKVAW